MARPIWTGSLSFGLVNIPVGLYSATEDRAVHFNQFQAGTSDRVRNKRVNERTGDEVGYAEIVKGYDLGGGEYVLLEPDELESVARERSGTIEISDFVQLTEIDPVYFKSAYYLGPQGKGSEKPYALLRRAMEEAGRVGLASFVFRSKEHLVAIRPGSTVLSLETMYYADEVRDPTEIGAPASDQDFSKRELDAAQLLIDSMAGPWKPEQYRDTYREQLLEMIERKSRGETISTERRVEEKAPVVDLLAALERSVANARSRRGPEAAEEGEDAGEGGSTRAKRTRRPASDGADGAEADAAESATATPKRSRRKAS